jgi:hypothetical protein
MSRRLMVVIAALAFAAVNPATALVRQADTVKVVINYKGKGQVDASHKLWVYLFSTPNVGSSSTPLGQVALTKNGTEALFTGVTSAQVYVAVAFDEKGVMGGDGPPPVGTPIGILTGPKGPQPVTPGTKVVTLSFDDSSRMQ